MTKPGQVSIVNTLRGLAAMMVCFYHFTWHSDPFSTLYPEGSLIRDIGYQGQIGVYVFFVISGFVIPLSLYYGKYDIGNFFRFILKRLLRLHPPFIASMLLFAILAVIYALKDGDGLDIDALRIIHNFFLTATFVDITWYADVYLTLAIEFQYYILVALIFPLLVHRRQWLSYIILVLFVLSAWFFDHDKKHYIFFHAPVFTIGIALFMHHIKKLNDLQLVVLVGWCMYQTRYEIGPEVAVAVSITAYAIAILHWRNHVSDFLGNISYSLYLTHGFIGCQFLWFTSRYADTLLEKTGLMLAAFALSIAFAWLFYRLFEIPSVRWSQAVKYKKIASNI